MKLTKLETGKYYWFRQEADSAYRPCYIGEDPDENQWFFQIDHEPWPVSQMGLEHFDFIELPQPPSIMHRRMIYETKEDTGTGQKD